MKDKTLEIAATGLVLMFLFSGLMKICTFLGYCVGKSKVSESERVSKKTGMCLPNASRIVFLAGVIEVLGSFLVLRGIWSSKKNISDVKTGSMILALFTILATLLFYVYPFKVRPFLANMTALSGLLLLPLVCGLKH